jgi:hypothetical protein
MWQVWCWSNPEGSEISAETGIVSIVLYGDRRGLRQMAADGQVSAGGKFNALGAPRPAFHALSAGAQPQRVPINADICREECVAGSRVNGLEVISESGDASL